MTPVRIPLAASELTAAASTFILAAAAEAAWLMAAVGGRPTTQGLGLPEARCRDLHEGGCMQVQGLASSPAAPPFSPSLRNSSPPPHTHIGYTAVAHLSPPIRDEDALRAADGEGCHPPATAAAPPWPPPLRDPSAESDADLPRALASFVAVNAW